MIYDENKKCFESNSRVICLADPHTFVSKRRYQILICLRKLLNPGRGKQSLQMSIVVGVTTLKVNSAGSRGVAVVFNSVRAFKSSDKRHSKKVSTKLM